MALSETVILALIVAIPAALSPVAIRWWDSRSLAQAKAAEADERRADKDQDWARQDAVSDRLLASNALVAKSANKLLESSALVVASASVTEERLKELVIGQTQIHTLVNSNLTAAKQAQLEALEAKLTVQREMTAFRKQVGKDVDKEALANMEATAIKIAELKAELADRLAQTDAAERDRDIAEHKAAEDTKTLETTKAGITAVAEAKRNHIDTVTEARLKGEI
jgi:hypothetical protein